MSFIQVEHQGAGIVINRLVIWSNVEKNDQLTTTANTVLDKYYKFLTENNIIPKKTGYMRSTAKLQSEKGYAQIVITAYYSGYVEKGSKRNKAHPFFFQNLVGVSVDVMIALRNLYGGIK